MSGWIKLSESKPPKDKLVLFCYYDYLYDKRYRNYDTGMRWTNYLGEEVYTIDGLIMDPSRIRAWMPFERCK